MVDDKVSVGTSTMNAQKFISLYAGGLAYQQWIDGLLWYQLMSIAKPNKQDWPQKKITKYSQNEKHTNNEIYTKCLKEWIFLDINNKPIKDVIGTCIKDIYGCD